MELPLPILFDFEVHTVIRFSPHSTSRTVPSVSGSRSFRFSHISQSPHVYGWKKIFERLGDELSGQLVPHKIGQIVLTNWCRRIGAAIR